MARHALAAALRTRASKSADLDARVLVCAARGIDHAALIRDPDLPLGNASGVLESSARRRLAGEPVARILGRREFWGLSFSVDEAVLDPRAETEGLVASILDALGKRQSEPLRILDLGTGSGAILCALLSELPRSFGIGIDRSLGACRTASRNVSALGLADRARVVCGSWSDALEARFEVIVSNPPYIPDEQIINLDPDVRDFDPYEALAGGPDGLSAYRAIIPRVAGLLTPRGIVALECGWDQGETVAFLMRSAGLRDVTTFKDLAGFDRVLVGNGA